MQGRDIKAKSMIVQMQQGLRSRRNIRSVKITYTVWLNWEAGLPGFGVRRNGNIGCRQYICGRGYAKGKEENLELGDNEPIFLNVAAD